MSTAFSKNKEKRPRSSSEPNKSFVKNVTSRVSGLLPATITKWFSSPSSSNTNGSAQGVEATDSSTEDEAPESPVTVQPPAKRMRYASPGNYNQYVPVETKCTSTNTEAIEDVYHTIPSPIGRSNYRRETNLMSTPINPAKEEASEGVIQENSFFKSQHSLSVIGHPVAKKRKSLFDNPIVETSKKRSPTYGNDIRDPYFKRSLLSSPFYVGRTMYGGAASSYMSEPNIRQRKTSLINEASDNDSVTISHSARRVMDLLEHYSSPLVDAKRIPPVARNYKKNNSMNTSQQSVNPYGPKVYSYKTQELYVPTVASILTIKRRSRLMDTTNAARQIIASHSSTSEFTPYPGTNSEGQSQNEESGDILTTKIKSRLTRTNRDRNADMEYNVADTVNLPTAVLQIDKDNLPRFTFGSSATSQGSQSSSIKTPVITALDSLKRTIETNKSTTNKPNDVENMKSVQGDNNNDLYKFSSPVRVSNETTNTSTTISKFNFGSPERNIDNVHEVKKKDDQLNSNYSNQVIVENKLSVLQSSDWKCLDCWVLNKSDVNNCVCCGGKKPNEVADKSKTCSVCKLSHNRPESDKCVECENKTNNVDKIFVAKGKSTSKWKCNDCWVDNEESVDKCVCCGGKKSKKSPPATVISITEKNVENEWKCNDCWIKNKSTLDKCAACGGLKPGSKPSNSTSSISESPKSSHGFAKLKESSDSTLKRVLEAQNEKWECPICLVRNDSDRSMCCCCEADKPGTIKECHKKLFNFHQPSEITFKFGIQPKVEETKEQDKINTESNMGQESETNNNLLPKTSTFNFGIPAKKVGDQPEPSVEKCAEAPKINFTFGIVKQDSVIPVRNSIFGVPAKTPEITNSSQGKEKPQEVPQVFNPPITEDKERTTQNIFSTLVTSNTSTEMPALVPLQQTNQISVTKAETALSSASILSTANSEAKPLQNTFTFSAIKPTTNLFATTSTTTTNVPTLSLSTPATTTASLFQTNAITTSTGSFFQKSDSAPTSVSLFPKTETATTAVTQGITQPIFSFGSQGATLVQPEKPKFNFNFGTNTTEPPALFKPTFGVSNDTTNNFNLTNSITTGNGVPGNPLNNTAQINVTNPLTTGNSDTTSPTPNIFGAAVQKENMWSQSNNMFTSNTTPIAAQKPPAFTFGSATGFNTNNTFGNTTQPTQNVFGIANQATTSQPLFGNQLQNQTTTNIFGSPQNANPMPMAMFGAPNANVAPAFGVQNPTPSFETPVMTPAPAPAFNFGSPQPTGIFGFGQQPQQNQAQPDGQQAQVQQAGMYNFGAPAGAPQLQFNMGSAPNNVGRRVFRKAMRRTQR